ncbi:hypothetical protein HFU84_12070 [Acidithiobacillus sp. CV18-2]|nr:hypothetical protein [Acidithiobacillus sp. CV18-3]MBU2758352.1 hypothetical protein [Acidithiobacillus sp. BN09-2]MBU2778223.1 hypothetical protein [Acidithiobacillus sp. CV18-2]MBU2799096.1 hypothetical protein [Acidithiobacillus sp. VAN18-4]
MGNKMTQQDHSIEKWARQFPVFVPSGAKRYPLAIGTKEVLFALYQADHPEVTGEALTDDLAAIERFLTRYCNNISYLQAVRKDKNGPRYRLDLTPCGIVTPDAAHYSREHSRVMRRAEREAQVASQQEKLARRQAWLQRKLERTQKKNERSERSDGTGDEHETVDC